LTARLADPGEEQVPAAAKAVLGILVEQRREPIAGSRRSTRA
jgi:hypothetical protein